MRESGKQTRGGPLRSLKGVRDHQPDGRTDGRTQSWIMRAVRLAPPRLTFRALAGVWRFSCMCVISLALIMPASPLPANNQHVQYAEDGNRLPSVDLPEVVLEQRGGGVAA